MTGTNTGGIYNSFTGVFREYRGQGIAMALKVVALDWAKQQKVPYARTNNHSANQPMLAVNRKLGKTSSKKQAGGGSPRRFSRRDLFEPQPPHQQDRCNGQVEQVP
jgi:GNAT superfamily N-acetyltransferase